MDIVLSATKQNIIKIITSALFLITIVSQVNFGKADDKITDLDANKYFYNVQRFGAIADGRVLNTKQIQAAINQCFENGGGVVFFPPGNYLTGRIYLKSNVTLYLVPNAVLLGSQNIADYSLETKEFIYADLQKCLIYAENADHIALTGGGKIDGQGQVFRGDRPMLMRLINCTNVTLSNLTFTNAASWCLNPVFCKKVRIEGIVIHNRIQPNNDGIDCDGCQDVIIANCNISSGDDAIALKTFDPRQPCKNIVITNCIISSRWAAFRFGPESIANFENITVSNCVINDTYGCGIKLQMNEGAQMKNILFDNLIMDNVTGPISLRLAGWLGFLKQRKQSLPIGNFQNVMFSNIRAKVAETAKPDMPGEKVNTGEERSCISITGLPEHYIEGITFSNIHITFPGGGTREEAERREIPDKPDDYPEYFMFGVLPAYGLYAHHAKNLIFNNVTFDLNHDDLRPAIVFDNVENTELTGLRAQGSAGSESLIRLQRSGNILINNCRPLNTIKTFLRIEGQLSTGIGLAGNDFRLVTNPVEFGDEVQNKVVETQGNLKMK